VILLLGGTSETVAIADLLSEKGLPVLVSTATDLPLRGMNRPGIRHRSGPLDPAGIRELIRSRNIRVVVDATHPFAREIHENAWAACLHAGIPYLAYDRPGLSADEPGIRWARDHEEAAEVSCRRGSRVLLTIGTRNLELYVKAARRRGAGITVRVLDHPASLSACRDMGVTEEEIIPSPGPLTLEENRLLIRKRRIDTLVTKDSGEAGGVPEKIRAARETGCSIVMIQRPRRPTNGYSSVTEILQAVQEILSGDRPIQA
jgi:precorrin-6A/cobalt-precorrin-6A reductase